MLTKDELDLRVGQTLGSRTYAELAAVTADLPQGWPQPSRPRRSGCRGDARVLRPGPVIAAATVLCAAVWAITFLGPWPANSEGDPPGGNNRAVLVGHLQLPVRFAHRCGLCDRRVAEEALRRAVVAAARRGWSRIPAPATGQPGQAVPACRPRSPAHRSCTKPPPPPVIAGFAVTAPLAYSRPAGPATACRHGRSLTPARRRPGAPCHANGQAARGTPACPPRFQWRLAGLAPATRVGLRADTSEPCRGPRNRPQDGDRTESAAEA
jgi:hypothetical protein